MKLFNQLFLIISIPLVASAQVFKSSATLRLEEHAKSGNCDVTIPNNPEWNIAFDRFNLKGDLAPNVTYTRRDPSSVLKVDGTYYVWYSYSLTNIPGKKAPWDFNDIYYSSSVDGYTWKEHGPAIQRGPEGSFDHRSAFTTEVFYHEGTFYLIYQAAAELEGIYDKNTIAMAFSSSPNGPWTKLEDSVLSPTVSDQPAFDDNAVHDPCLIYFKDKFYLYYKGETSTPKPVCGLGIWGLNKQVKWGVAVSDNPTGPFVKSKYNPITNTGHEVCVWNSGKGIGIMLHQDGPEFGTLQYAEDGENFDIKGKITDFVRTNHNSFDYPEAAGLYRSINKEVSPVSGVSWGICHQLTREQGSFWMYLKRFENVNKKIIVDDADNKGINLDRLSSKKTNPAIKVGVYPNPTSNNLYIDSVEPGNYNLEIISISGQIVKTETYNSTTVDSINVSDIKKGVYVLKLKNKKNTYKANFIKQNSK